MIDYGFVLKTDQSLTEAQLDNIRSIGLRLFRQSYLESEHLTDSLPSSAFEVSLRLAVCPLSSAISLERRATAGDVLVGDLVALGCEVAKGWKAKGVFWQVFYGGWRIRYFEEGKWYLEDFASERDGSRFVPGIADTLANVDNRMKLATKLSEAFKCSAGRLLDLMKYTHEPAEADSAEQLGSVTMRGGFRRDDPRRVFDLVGALGLHHPYNHAQECEFYQYRGLSGIVVTR